MHFIGRRMITFQQYTYINEAFYSNYLTWFVVVVDIYRNRLHHTHVIFPVKLHIHAKFTIIRNLR